MDHAFLCAGYPLLGTSTQLGSTSLKQGAQTPSFSCPSRTVRRLPACTPVAVPAIQPASCSSWQSQSAERKKHLMAKEVKQSRSENTISSTGLWLEKMALYKGKLSVRKG